MIQAFGSDPSPEATNSRELLVWNVAGNPNGMPGTEYEKEYLRVITSVPMWEDEPYGTPTRDALRFERGVTAQYNQNLPTYEVVAEPDPGLPPLQDNKQLWVRHRGEAKLDTPTDPIALNQRIKQNVDVGVAAETIPGAPNVIRLFRNIGYGALALREVRKLRGVMVADVIPTGKDNPEAEPALRIYPKGLLLGVVIDPIFQSDARSRVIKELDEFLTSDLYPRHRFYGATERF